jgi:peptide/nickel transport system substrate-binding protein
MKTAQRFAGLPVVMFLAAAAGCGERGDPAPRVGDDGAAEQGGTVVIAEVADINHPMMLLAASAFDANLSGDLMNRELLRGVWRDGRLEYVTAEESPMALARRYEYLPPDSAAIRFHMRSDARWSDGTPVTARDVQFTYRWAADPALASPRLDYVQHLDSVSVQNDSVLTFHFRRRYADMLAHTTIAPIPMHVYADVDPAQLRNHPTITSPAGTLPVSGPFMIGRHVRGQQIVLVRNPHFEPRANLDQIVFRIIPDATTRLLELQTGAVDWVTNVTFDQIPRLRQQAPNLNWEVEQKRAFDYVAYNPERFEAFADPDVRRALGLAIDVPAMIRALQMEEFAVPAGGPYPPILSDLYDESETPPLGHDPEEARRILASKGWADSDGDGVLERNGRPFRITLLTGAGNQRRADASQIIQQQWRRIGVDAQLRAVEFNTFMSTLFARDYEVALGGWVAGLTPDLTQIWGPDPRSTSSRTGTPRCRGSSSRHWRSRPPMPPRPTGDRRPHGSRGTSPIPGSTSSTASAASTSGSAACGSTATVPTRTRGSGGSPPTAAGPAEPRPATSPRRVTPRPRVIPCPPGRADSAGACPGGRAGAAVDGPAPHRTPGPISADAALRAGPDRHVDPAADAEDRVHLPSVRK